jgi:putative ABC transport system ATP-binding protein
VEGEDGILIEHDNRHAQNRKHDQSVPCRRGGNHRLKPCELPLLYLKIAAAERKQRVDAVMERLGITARRSHFPQQLSGGQQQRVAIARAVVAGPKLILADEPTGNLDSAHGQEVMDLLVKLNSEGTTIVMVTHSSTDSKRAHRIVQLFDGCIRGGNVKGESRV